MTTTTPTLRCTSCGDVLMVPTAAHATYAGRDIAVATARHYAAQHGIPPMPMPTQRPA